MKQNKQNKIVIIFLIGLILIVAIVKITSKGKVKEARAKYMQMQEDGTKINTSKKVNETKKYKGLEFSNIKFTSSEAFTNFAAEVKNTTDKDMEEQSVTIKVLDDKGQVMVSYGGTIRELKAGEITHISSAISGDFGDAYNIEIVEPVKIENNENLEQKDEAQKTEDKSNVEKNEENKKEEEKNNIKQDNMNNVTVTENVTNEN